MGQKTGHLDSDQIAKLEQGYVGKQVRLMVYETGGFSGIPRAIPGDFTPVAGSRVLVFHNVGGAASNSHGAHYGRTLHRTALRTILASIRMPMADLVMRMREDSTLAGGFVAATGSNASGGRGMGHPRLVHPVVAVVLGMLATVLAFGFIESTAGQDRGPKTRIVVAKHDLRPNVAIDPDRDLQAEEIPTRFGSLAAQSLDWDARVNYKGQRLNRRVLAGQPVFLADLSAMGELRLSEGTRALTIAAEPGIVIPGDYVKILVPRMDPAVAGGAADPNRAPYQVMLIGRGNGYRVLAVGGSLFKTRQQVTASDQYEAGSGSGKTVTLEVTEDQAGEILRSLGNGQQKATLLLAVTKEAAGTQP